MLAFTLYVFHVQAAPCPLSPLSTARTTTLCWRWGKVFIEGSSSADLCLQRSLLGCQGEKKNSNLRTPSFFGHTQLNLSQNYSSVLRRTLKACPNTLPSLQMGLGKESRDTVKSESLLENQIHRLGKFSRATPSWPVGKPQGDCQRLQGGQS